MTRRFKYSADAEFRSQKYSLTYIDEYGCNHQMYVHMTLKKLYKKLTELQKQGCVIRKVKEVKE